ncbi:MAG TPA: aminotransferase class I/II-fold pyridoxal phosphate-dependent enzyme, partial [Planctomycetota bacterium]|nr:aminotransferase class I/II-fold pyridoxal phosphate-dependent enzyme [Planctomycetota bacterium]
MNPGPALRTGSHPLLAVLGGEPAFPDKLHVGRPNLGDRERFLSRVERILDSAWLTNDGPFAKDFERRVAALAGTRHAIAMCNATIALELVTRALGMRGEVILPAFTFVATAHALQWQEVRPVFADVDPRTHNLDPASVERLITPHTTGIVGVHVWGRACAVEDLQALADERGLQLVFDAAHALGCTHRGRPIGGFGRAEVFSFHATKVCNSFEGGVVTTNDDELAQKLRLMRNFGFAGKDRVVHLGSNGKLNEVSAAMGLTSLDSLDEFVATNRANHRRYAERLRGLAGLALLEYDPRERNNHQYVVVEVDPDRSALTRDELVAVLEAEGCLARRYFYPGVHRMEPYRSLQPVAALALPATASATGSYSVYACKGPTGTSAPAAGW